VFHELWFGAQRTSAHARVIQSAGVAYLVKSCVVCGSHEIELHWSTERVATITCKACRRVLQIEFNPPDQPDVRGRIDVVFDPETDGDGDAPSVA